ncbi:MAG: DUF1211 domain-containing protein [Bacteroidetes bacterium]|nr:DUF1211 domain-containing protein [Bacteroidota bacterium]
MFRSKTDKLINQNHDAIRWRGKDINRIEALSDAVFALSFTLIIVSLEVPKNYDALIESLRHFGSFGICFAILLVIWFTQNLFFRRFGLADVRIVVLNGFLLFTCLFFVYPLKFMFSVRGEFLYEQTRNLYILYNAGFIVIFILFALMYRHAAKCASQLELTDKEQFATNTQTINNLFIALVGFVPILIALAGERAVNFAPLGYAAIWPVSAITDRYRKKLFQKRFMNN